MPAPLRLVVYDKTDVRSLESRLRARPYHAPDGSLRDGPGLAPIWLAGAWMHRVSRAADASRGVESWAEAIAWAVRTADERGRPIGSLQAWGHGGWGYMLLGEGRLDERALAPDHALASLLDDLKRRLAGPDALVWLRCCSAFGQVAGLRFARRLADRLGCRVAGHTYVIGLFQSGTHSLRPGEEPRWDEREGTRYLGSRPQGAMMSLPGAPRTISCFALDLPAGL